MSNKKENVTCERFSLTSHILLFYTVNPKAVMR